MATSDLEWTEVWNEGVAGERRTIWRARFKFGGVRRRLCTMCVRGDAVCTVHVSRCTLLSTVLHRSWLACSVKTAASVLELLSALHVPLPSFHLMIDTIHVWAVHAGVNTNSELGGPGADSALIWC